VVGYGVVVHKVADMDDYIALATVKYLNTEIKVIGPLKRDMAISDYTDTFSDINSLFLFRHNGYSRTPAKPDMDLVGI
jgi:hypothetical protein